MSGAQAFRRYALTVGEPTARRHLRHMAKGASDLKSRPLEALQAMTRQGLVKQVWEGVEPGQERFGLARRYALTELGRAALAHATGAAHPDPETMGAGDEG